MSDITLGIRLKADGSGFVGEVRQGQAALERLGRSGRAAGQGLGRTSQAGRRWGRLAPILNRRNEQLAASYDQMHRRVDLVRIAMLALATGAAARLVGSFISAASETENLRLRLRFLTDDAGTAADTVVDFAGQVPFAFQEIQQAAPILLTVARDVEEFGRLLQITGDIAATSGLSFIETAQQLQRSFAAGINSADLFRERGVRAMLGFEAGVQTSAEETRRHILALWEEGTTALKGASAEMADTWTGLTSMLGDKWFKFRVQLMDGAPFDFLKAAAAEVDDRLGQRFDSIENAADQLGETLVEVVQDIAIGGAQAADTLAPVADIAIAAVNELIETFNNLPPFMQQAGVFGAMLFGKQFGVMFFGGMALADEMAALSKKMLDDAGVAQESILRDIFVGQPLLEKTTVGPLGGDDSFEANLRDFLARVQARREKIREEADRARAAGGSGPSGAGDRSGGGDSDDVIAELEEETTALGRLADAHRNLGTTVEEARLRNKIDRELREANVSIASEEGRSIVRLMRRRHELNRQIEAAEQAEKRRHKTLERGRQLTEELLTPTEAYKQEILDINRLLTAGAITGETALRAREAATERLAEAQAGNNEALQRGREFAEDFGLTFKSAFEDAIVEGEGLSEVLQGIEKDLLRIAIRRTVTEPIGGLLDDAFSGALDDLFTTSTTAAVPSFSGGAGGGLGQPLPTYHEGGVVGEAARYKPVDPRAFIGAPRYHGGGLVGDERPIIARMGEEVLTADDPRHRNNLAPAGGTRVEVNVIDRSGGGTEKRVQQRQGPEGPVIDVMIDAVSDAIHDGRLDDPITGRFATRVRTEGIV